ncbi:MAG: HK97 family phage prohead protease [bacterium]|nr:HK97 family phage prohead protease [bacterium]
MDKIIRKTFQASETKAADDDSRSLIVKISTTSPDRSRDVVKAHGVKTDHYLKNPVVAFSHRYNEPAIAKTDELQITDDGIVAKLTFPEKGVYALSDTLYALYKDGFMNAWSIGFIPLKWNDRDEGGHEFTEWELLEYSAVLVPDNPEALTMLREFKQKGIDTTPIETLLKDDELIDRIKGVIHGELEALLEKHKIVETVTVEKIVEVIKEVKGEDQVLSVLSHMRSMLKTSDKNVGLSLKLLNNLLDTQKVSLKGGE